VPFDSTTYTFTFGPQINFRQLKWITLFVRPAIGGMHETATLKPNTPILALVTAQLAPSGKKTDLKPFYGIGGFDINATKHFGIRFAADFVHVNLFDDLLNEGRNSLRLAIGPTFRFGRNVGEKYRSRDNCGSCLRNYFQNGTVCSITVHTGIHLYLAFLASHHSC